MIEFLEQAVQKKIENTPLERWEKLGFLEGIENKRIRIMTADFFERLAQYILNNEDKIEELTKNKVIRRVDLECIVFPIARRLLNTLEFIQTMRDNPEEYIKEVVNYWEDNKSFIEDKSIELDKEAELGNGFSGVKYNFSKLFSYIKEQWQTSNQLLNGAAQNEANQAQL